jgi:hypothetical protein
MEINCYYEIIHILLENKSAPLFFFFFFFTRSLFQLCVFLFCVRFSPLLSDYPDLLGLVLFSLYYCIIG